MYLLFSLEISKEDYERRFDSRAAMVSSNGLKRGTLTEQEEVLYEKYLSNIKFGKRNFQNEFSRRNDKICRKRIQKIS